jgi:hypothetical protein
MGRVASTKISPLGELALGEDRDRRLRERIIIKMMSLLN